MGENPRLPNTVQHSQEADTWGASCLAPHADISEQYTLLSFKILEWMQLKQYSPILVLGESTSLVTQVSGV